MKKKIKEDMKILSLEDLAYDSIADKQDMDRYLFDILGRGKPITMKFNFLPSTTLEDFKHIKIGSPVKIFVDDVKYTARITSRRKVKVTP